MNLIIKLRGALMIEFAENGRVTAAEISCLRESVGWNPMSYEYEKALENATLCISCYDNNRLVRFINVVSNFSTDAYIQDVMVLPEYQKQGIGTQLEHFSLAKPDKLSFSQVLVQAKTHKHNDTASSAPDNPFIINFIIHHLA